MSEHNAPGTADAPDGAGIPQRVPAHGRRRSAAGRHRRVGRRRRSRRVRRPSTSPGSRSTRGPWSAGDLYVALPGAARHGADFVAQAIEAGAAAVLTDDAGARLLALSHRHLRAGAAWWTSPAAVVGRLSALIYRSQAADGPSPSLFGVTGTNGKTTTTYFINALLQALGQKTGLIGTIEILAGGEPIPSLLTTPESTDVHALLALMRERGLDAASMEVSSHAVSFHRVDGVVFDVAGFTNLTQDHLDLHGTMEDYFRTKAELFTAERARAAVVTVDDEWGTPARGRRRAFRSPPSPPRRRRPAPAAAARLDRHRQPRRAAWAPNSRCSSRNGTELRVHTGLPGQLQRLQRRPGHRHGAGRRGRRRRRAGRPRRRATPSPWPCPAACSSSPPRPPRSSTSRTTRTPWPGPWRPSAHRSPASQGDRGLRRHRPAGPGQTPGHGSHRRPARRRRDRQRRRPPRRGRRGHPGRRAGRSPRRQGDRRPRLRRSWKSSRATPPSGRPLNWPRRRTPSSLPGAATKCGRRSRASTLPSTTGWSSGTP